MSVKEDQLNILAGVNSDMPLLESPSWSDVYASQLQDDEEFRMANWHTIVSLAERLNPVVRGQIKKPLSGIAEDDEEALIAARKTVVEAVLWQTYGSNCRCLNPVDKRGNTVQPSAIAFPLAVRFRRKKW